MRMRRKILIMILIMVIFMVMRETIMIMVTMIMVGKEGVTKRFFFLQLTNFSSLP